MKPKFDKAVEADVAFQQLITETIRKLAIEHKMTPVDAMRACVMTAGEIAFTHHKAETTIAEATQTVVEIAQEHAKHAKEFCNRTN